MAEMQSFGQWLRRCRRELDLSQDALSQAIGCAQITIRKMEADLLRPSRQMAELLVEKLGIPPEKRELYIRFARSGIFPAPVLPNPPPNNLPQALTSFVGREREVDEVHRLIDSSRLVTLTGVGGTGKTRLSLQVAAGVLERYSDGAWFIELSSLADPALVPQAVAATLGLQKTGEASYPAILINYLQDRHLLLILDNCEHMLDACAWLVNALLQRCPKVAILATSRERLGIAGEKTYKVPPLTALDPEKVTDHHQLERTDSIRLFVERVGAILPDFRLTSQALSDAARVCRRLDGIPLAIELAAARMSVLSLEQIADRLDDRFRLLTGGSRVALPRQRTLRASIDWSYGLLPESERLLLQRLAIFAGGWTLEAAEAVCALDGLEGGQILDALNSLEKKSLVVADTLSGAQARYRMLETIRQYAAEKLEHEKPTKEGLGDADLRTALRDRHLAFFLALAREYGPRLKTAQITEILQLIDPELDNLRAAITWALGKGDRLGAEAALGILTALDYFWATRALYWETFPRFLHALERLPDAEIPSAELKAWGFYVLSTLQADFMIGWETLGYLNQSVALFRQVGNRHGLGLALALRTFVIFRHNFFFPPDPAICQEDALRDQKESLAIAHALSQVQGNEIPGVFAWADCWNGAAEFFHGNPTEGRVLGQRAQRRFRQLGDRIGELYGRVVTLYASLNLGAGLEILPDVDQAMELANQINHKWYQSHFFEMKAGIYYALGQYLEFEANIRQNIVLHQQMGSIRGEISPHIWLGDHYANQQDIPKALIQLHQALSQLTQEVRQKDLYLTLNALTVFAKLALQTDQPNHALKLLGFVERTLEGYSKEFRVFDRQRFEQCQQKAKEALGESEFEVWQQCMEMTMELAVAVALDVTDKRDQ